MDDPTNPDPPNPPSGQEVGRARTRMHRGPRHARRQSGWNPWRWVLLSLSVVALVAAGAITYNIVSFYQRSDSGGRALIHQVQRQVARAEAHHTCTSVPATPTTTVSTSGGVGTSGLSLAGVPTTANQGHSRHPMRSSRRLP